MRPQRDADDGDGGDRKDGDTQTEVFPRARAAFVSSFVTHRWLRLGGYSLRVVLANHVPS
jgi:hypothetical protein